MTMRSAATRSDIINEEVRVRLFRPEDASDWNTFLTSSVNGTLFHDLSFLAYHPPERFDIHHLLFERNGRLVALMPGAIVTEADGRRFLKSPYGGSVGGPVLPRPQAKMTLELVSALQEYSSSLGLAGIELRIGPSIYSAPANDCLSFALAASGFSLTRRWLTHVISLPPDPSEVLLNLSSRRRQYVQASLRRGLAVSLADSGRLPEFYGMLEEDRSRHGARPTHTLHELQRIFDLVSDKTRLFLCNLGEELVAATVVFEMNDRVAYSFYPCHDSRFDEHRPLMLLNVAVAEAYAGRGFSYLDLGPSTFDDMSPNDGLIRFKEELGAIGFCRDSWRWESAD